MHNALAATAVLPTHPQHSGVEDLRARLHACSSDERTAWSRLQQVLEEAMAQHAHELHFDQEPECIRCRYRSAYAATEHQLATQDALNDALTLLYQQLWPNKSDQLSNKAWFLIQVAQQAMIFQIEYVKTSAGSGMTLRPLYDTQNPLPQLEQVLQLEGQANLMRQCIKSGEGLILLADLDRSQRVKSARAIAQALTGPDQRILLSETNCHPLVPGTTQIALPLHATKEQQHAWRQACDMSYNVMMALECNAQTAQFAHHANQDALVIQGVSADKPSLALTQLIANGTRPESIARSLNFIITQHRIAIACEHCKCPTQVDERIEQWMYQHSPVKSGAISDWLAERLLDNFVEAPGCYQCHDTGVSTVTTMIDSIQLSTDVQEALFDADVRYATKALQQQNSFSNKIIALAQTGKISLSHAARHLGK